MTLRTDRGGLESLPLKLMIVALVASLSIIPAAEALNNLRNRDFANRVELQLDLIVSTAQILAIGGPGGARTMNLDFTSDGTIGFDRMVIGGDRGANMSSVVLRFTNGAVMVRTCTDPAVWMRTCEGQGLLIESPVSRIGLIAQVEGWTEYILVEAS